MVAVNHNVRFRLCYYEKSNLTEFSTILHWVGRSKDQINQSCSIFWGRLFFLAIMGVYHSSRINKSHSLWRECQNISRERASNNLYVTNQSYHPINITKTLIFAMIYFMEICTSAQLLSPVKYILISLNLRAPPPLQREKKKSFNIVSIFPKSLPSCWIMTQLSNDYIFSKAPFPPNRDITAGNIEECSSFPDKFSLQI